MSHRTSANFSAFIFIFAAALGVSSFAYAASKEEVLKKYEKVLILAEELNVYQQDVHGVVPKIKFSTQALLGDEFEKADEVLDNVLWELERMKMTVPKQHQKIFRLEWLEIYLDIFQKFGMLALLAYLGLHLPFLRKIITANQGSQFYLTIVVIICAMGLSLFDLRRYGDSAWVFLDFHVILIAIGGLLGGIWTGVFSGVVIGCFRWLFKSDPLISFGVALGTGILSGLLSPKFKAHNEARTALYYGLLMGAFHSLIIYLPMAKVYPWPYLLLSAVLLTFLEGSAIFIFFGIISAILREESRRDMEKELLKTQLLFLQAQINPHFLYNALNTIGEVYASGNIEEGSNLIHRLSEFFRRTAKRANDLVTLREELHHIDAYIEIEKARFQNRLKVEKQFDIPEDYWDSKIPMLILQPLVENAIKHGIGKKMNGGTLSIHIGAENGNVCVEIADNGVGMSQNVINGLMHGENKSSMGTGIHNINQRLLKLWGPDCQLRFESEVGIGTKVTVPIPVDHTNGNKKRGDHP